MCAHARVSVMYARNFKRAGNDENYDCKIFLFLEKNNSVSDAQMNRFQLTIVCQKISSIYNWMIQLCLKIIS